MRFLTTEHGTSGTSELTRLGSDPFAGSLLNALVSVFTRDCIKLLTLLTQLLLKTNLNKESVINDYKLSEQFVRQISRLSSTLQYLVLKAGRGGTGPSLR